MNIYINPQIDETGRRIIKILLFSALILFVVAIVLTFLGLTGRI